MVGPYNSTVAAAQIPISNKAGLLQCSPSATSEGLTRPEAGAAKLRPSRPDAVNFVRTVTTNEIDPVGAAMYLLDRLGQKAVYMVDNGAGSAVSGSERFQRTGRSVARRSSGRQSVVGSHGLLEGRLGRKGCRRRCRVFQRLIRCVADRGAYPEGDAGRRSRCAVHGLGRRSSMARPARRTRSSTSRPTSRDGRLHVLSGGGRLPGP